MRDINKRLQEMTNKINSEDFLKSHGLGNEVNYHVFDYNPDDEFVVREYLNNYLIPKSSLKIKEFNIYNIILDILEEKGFLEKVFEFEKKKGTRYINGIISKTLGISTSNDQIVKRIKENVEENDIVIITGIGETYGIVRGHTILNNLQSSITSNPLIMFYPGIYDGQSFQLFNKLANDNYYRAFQFVER